ncbi:MAG TPA: hypothetical protein VFU30_13815 [Gaiellaceae bacterium]|nr:hypothetical protein [Gaiellaceae bacterium]
MKRALAIFFATALLGIALPVGSALADPVAVGATNGVCANNPGQGTHNLNNGNHVGIVNNCVAI